MRVRTKCFSKTCYSCRRRIHTWFCLRHDWRSVRKHIFGHSVRLPCTWYRVKGTIGYLVRTDSHGCTLTPSASSSDSLLQTRNLRGFRFRTLHGERQQAGLQPWLEFGGTIKRIPCLMVQELKNCLKTLHCFCRPITHSVKFYMKLYNFTRNFTTLHEIAIHKNSTFTRITSSCHRRNSMNLYAIEKIMRALETRRPALLFTLKIV